MSAGMLSRVAVVPVRGGAVVAGGAECVAECGGSALLIGDGTELAARRLERTLKADPGMGIVRHVDAGYDLAASASRDHGLRIPMLAPE